MNRVITPDAWKSLSQSLMVEEAALRAVAAVESSGSGFLALPSDLPKVLFEGHAFHRLTQGRFDTVEPTLSFPKWTREFYSGSASGEWKRLDRAKELDRAAALQSASWGMFQIMGFNYALCGFSDVDAFTAAQCSGADGQLDSFARFIARDLFLLPLRRREWAAFAAAYNGPAFAKNQYDRKLAAAYEAFRPVQAPAAAGAAGRRRKPSRKSVVAKGVKPKSRPQQGRPEFAAVRAPRRQPFRRTVKPDPVDLRDFVYRPSVAKAPPPSLLPHKLRPVSNQGDTQACTGFSLATTIEYLLERSQRPIEALSGFMLYSMARRYDEWTDNDNRDEGSSLRGALKGWSRHGASALRLWKNMKMPPATFKRETDWWQDSVTRPLGAYYRLTTDVVSDIHVALSEVGVVYASAVTHGGWDELAGDHVQPPSQTADELPVIKARPGIEGGGHAFAIVGYTDKGFVVQNSWGPDWGRGGFAILTYSDWRKNAMDCWVVQLGVVTTEHEQVAAAATLRVEGSAGRVLISSNENLAAHEISPFVIDMQNEGRLSDRGQFRTSVDDLKLLLDHHVPEAVKRWSIKANGTIDVAIYAHGGLNSEEDAAITARQWIPLLYSNGIFPIFLMWETSGLDSVFNIVEDAMKGDEDRIGADWWNRFKDRVVDWKNERVEGIARVPGGALWRQMKDNAEDISSTRVSGVVQLFQLFKDRQRKLPKIRLHAIGHSAGAIVHSYLTARALKLGFEVGSVNLLAPAVRVDVFSEQLGPGIAKSGLRVFLAHLTDAAERADHASRVYGHSLLYLVSRAFEGETDTAILGMEKHLVPALVAHEWGSSITRLASPGAANRPGDKLTTATTHGGVDDDPAVQDAVIRNIKGPKFEGAIVRSANGAGGESG